MKSNLEKSNYLVLMIFLLFGHYNSIGQKSEESFQSKDSLYNSNIKKSKLYGVYIPRDIDDALVKLMELTTEEARKPLLKANEEVVAKKLHFGLGRWMEYNWNFVEGSRFSHLLRQKGIYHHDDMTKFMLITFHRHLLKKDLETDNLIKKLAEERENKIKAEQDKMPVISVETKPIPKNH